MKRIVSVLLVLALACGGTIGGDGGVPDGGQGQDGNPPPPIIVEKVDLLFAIDNSASMADKQGLFATAVPVFVNRLLNPNCVNAATTCKGAGDCAALGKSAQCDVNGNAGAGECFVPGDGQACIGFPDTKPEFAAVHDLHIGIVSSSLGGGGSPDICVESNPDSTHQNDHGQLLNRTLINAGPPPSEGSINNARPLDGNGGNFLAWLPQSNPKNAGQAPPNVTVYNDGQANQLALDFQALVVGVQQYGCGLEAQLESWYHFLIQPDPWDTITLDTSNPPRAILGSNNGTGVDTTVLKMRHDFLRPDSLVAIIQLTDEEDSWSDPLWLGGYGWTARTLQFPGGPGEGAGPIGTSECNVPVNINTNPPSGGSNDPNCTSCAFPSSSKPGPTSVTTGTDLLIGDDPNCNACGPGATACPQKGWYTFAAPSVPITAADGVDVRYSRQVMRSKYGFDNQFNYHRYSDGLSLPTVPDRNNESHDSTNYAPTRNCKNPLFAESLPDGSDTTPSTLCELAPGVRTPDMVFYAIIGGVPNQLLTDSNGNLKLDLTVSDWKAILGSDPDYYVFDGIDPHMIQSTSPRQGLEPPPTGAYNLGSDPINGREWNTLTTEACKVATYLCPAAIDFQYACVFDLPAPKDCFDPVNYPCDCIGTAASAPDGPPLCDVTTRSTQIKGKAYPQSRYQLVAKALGSQSVVGSICASSTTGDPTAPSYGYNGTLNAILDRIRSRLPTQ